MFHSKAFVNIWERQAFIRFTVAGLYPSSINSVWYCSISITLKRRSGRFPNRSASLSIKCDTLEDTRVTFDELLEIFGKEIADLVNSVSEPNKSDWIWENRKAHSLKHLKGSSHNQFVLAFADKLDNIRSIREDHERIGDKLWMRFNRPKEKQKWYYEALVVIFSDRLIDDKYLPLVNCFVADVKTIFG